jgi:hypothetical protein
MVSLRCKGPARTGKLITRSSTLTAYCSLVTLGYADKTPKCLICCVCRLLSHFAFFVFLSIPRCVCSGKAAFHFRMVDLRCLSAGTYVW